MAGRLVALMTCALLVFGCGSQAGRSATARAAVDSGSPDFSFAQTQIVPAAAMSPAGPFTRTLPTGPWALSFDLRGAARSTVAIDVGSTAMSVLWPSAGPPMYRFGTSGTWTQLAPRPGWLEAGGWRHFELASAASTTMRIDGQPIALPRAHGSRLSFATVSGHGSLSALIISPLAERGALLLHRLAELHARVPLGYYPGGADLGDNIHYDHSWMSGFWPGALWQAAAIEPAGGMFARWALRVTVRHFGGERADTHDVGFMYGESSLAGWRALCASSGSSAGAASVGASSASVPAVCARLRASVLGAADELVALAAGNPGAGTIPINATDPVADTIIDSTMNIGILPWATTVTGNRSYAALASHHAHKVASLLVRPDGSTAQAVYFDRQTGRVLSIGTHQGLSNSSTWARGQAWAVYGFAQAAAQLHDRGLLAVANHVAAYVASHLPAAGIPLWDYDAPTGAPVDVSAGTITAAGLLHLAAACHELAGPCADAAAWTPLARRMLAAALTKISTVPPLGLLRSQVLNEPGSGQGCWCNKSELIFGDSYALEALRMLDPLAPAEGIIR
jgi:unsaturated chondroitin disaccharide hydrolase